MVTVSRRPVGSDCTPSDERIACFAGQAEVANRFDDRPSPTLRTSSRTCAPVCLDTCLLNAQPVVTMKYVTEEYLDSWIESSRVFQASLFMRVVVFQASLFM